MSEKIEPAKVRAWGLSKGLNIGKRGRLSQTLIDAYVRDTMNDNQDDN